MARSEAAKRPYLSYQQRHDALLEAAAVLVETQGWRALTMVSLARKAGVSRQLVYQHFDSVDSLILAVLRHIFQDVYVRTRDEVLNAPQASPAKAAHAVMQISMDIPVGRARALWQAISASGAGDGGEIAVASRRLRHLTIKIVQPLVEQSLGLPAEQAGPLAWMLIIAFWGARQMIDDGELSSAQAGELYDWMIGRVLGDEAALASPAFSARQRKRKQ